MEKLRKALKTLSEAEKQLRMSNDKLTWLTAALLQLAPDQQYMLPSSSADTSLNHSPLAINNSSCRDTARKDITGASGGQISGEGHKEIEAIWLAVLEKIQINTLKQFMHQEGKLISVSFGAAPTIQLMFSSHLTKSKAEKFRGHILQAFESVLGSPVTIGIRYESKKDLRSGFQVPLILPASEDGSSQIITNPESVTNNRMPKAGYDSNIKRDPKDKVVKGMGSSQSKLLHSDSLDTGKCEIVEMAASPREPTCIENIDNLAQFDQRGLESHWIGEAASSHHQSTLSSLPERRKIGEQHQSQSLVRGKVSLAHVIQQAEGCKQRSGWSSRKAISIAEKLEHENLYVVHAIINFLDYRVSFIYVISVRN
ncbi:hypothetical protein HHK36_001694 [Tetracentron sinense]|uniref:STICHEL DnaA-N-like alpha-beta domain-containing protein n=1 Tax=Tetracentron sinense TaxID=13715 RepID=A0A835DV92_TETSI|nr:hypothetical protein HHK36_001694 [Tetracentron sinense]